jgi:hypothetical protein
MKYSNYLGIAIAVALITTCFMPWVYIPSINTTVTGMKAPHTNFGSPGLMNIVMSVVALIFFAVPKVWAKRTNVFICTFNVAWTVRNYILITQCELGECPEKKWGIYALVVFSILLFVMALLPKMDINEPAPGNLH